MSARDRLAVMIVAAGVLLFGMWFVAVSPERQKAAQAAAALASAQSQRDAALVAERTAEQARSNFGANVNALAKLGQAVPASQDISSLLAELESTARAQGVDFRSITSGSGGSAAGGPTSAAAAPATPSPAPTGGPVAGPTSSANAAVGKANASSAAAANANPGAPTPPGAAGASTASTGSFPGQTFNMIVAGDFVHLQGYLNTLNHWTSVSAGHVTVSGPLLSIQSVTLQTGGAGGAGGAPNPVAVSSGNGSMSATVSISVYTLPPGQSTPAALLAQLQPSATAPIARPNVPATGVHARGSTAVPATGVHASGSTAVPASHSGGAATPVVRVTR